MKRFSISLLVFVLAAASSLGQTPVPVGAEFQVNSFTIGSQFFPDVAVAADGDFVVVWTSYGSPGSDYLAGSVQAQRFADDGSMLGAQFQVNTYTPFGQRTPSVDVDGDGNFVVVWENVYSPDGILVNIQAQRYAANGMALGSELRIDQAGVALQSPSVAMDSDGEFMVAWRDAYYAVSARPFAADGTPLGDSFFVNSTGGRKRAPSIAVGGSGDFVVTWADAGSAGSDTDGYSVQVRRYAGDGTPLGGQFQVNSYTTSSQTYPSVAADADGDFVVVWWSGGSAGTDSDGASIQAQRYAANGTEIGGEFQVNSYTTGGQSFPSVSMAPEGDFVVSWTSDGSDGSDTDSFSIQAQYFALDGVPIGEQFQVNTYTTNAQSRSKAGQGTGGQLVIAWSSVGSAGNDTDFASVLAQRYAFSIFTDGFESGDISAWSASVP